MRPLWSTLFVGIAAGLATPINTYCRQLDPQTVLVSLLTTVTGWHRRRLMPARSQTLLSILGRSGESWYSSA